jgi:hypothetical protein
MFCKPVSGKSPLIFFLFFILLALISWPTSNSHAHDQWDLYSDTWVARDALDRNLPGFEKCGPPRENKFVGIFYWTWHKHHSKRGPFDNTKIITEGSEKLQWGPIRAAHHWGEPELGYYISTDPYVIRKHASMLTDAGVDVIIFDTTNPPHTFKDSYMALCKEYEKMRQQGNKTPQIAFLTPFGDPRSIVEKVYQDLYQPGLYREIWFQWKGKPLIMADPKFFAGKDIENFFTFRKPIPSYFTGPSDPNQWGWLEVYPQHVFYSDKCKKEQVTVGVAQNAVDRELAFMSHREGAMGRSWHNGSIDSRSGAVNYGYNFAEQWDRALEIDPEFVFITGWNEWVAGRFEKWYKYTTRNSYHPDAMFVDQYDHEYSRDIEPMKGGHGDNYYYQMISYIRRFKGVRQPRVATEYKSIQIDGDFSDWAQVQPEFTDTIGDTLHRDHRGYGSSHYTNTSGRNDIIIAKVSCDLENVYFYVKTLKPLNHFSNRNWMLLFIDTDLDKSNGWHGYDYLINSHVLDTRNTTLKKYTAINEWQTVSKIKYKTTKNEMELKVPRTVMNLDLARETTFDFHWADNMANSNDIVEFSVNGDSAPNRRFSYRYHLKIQEPAK